MSVTPELEDLAFAIHAGGYHHLDDIESGLARDLWDRNEWPEEFNKARRQARAALMAIHDPSAGMFNAALAEDLKNHPRGNAGSHAHWRAMIDHILNGEPE